MKIIKILALFLLLVVCPLGSWYYLQTGLDFRKDLAEKLEVKDHVSVFVSEENRDIFLKKTSLVVLPQADVKKAELLSIFDQFKKGYTFQLINTQSAFANAEESQERNWKNEEIQFVDSRLLGKSFMIVDTASNVRNYYASTTDDLKELVRQLAVTIPSKPTRDIVLKKPSNER